MSNGCRTSILLEHRAAKGILAGSLLLGFLVLYMVPPANLPVPACIFHSITGHSCLTCGLTRSLHAASHGEVAASFGYHLFGPVIFLGMLLCMLTFAAEAISGRGLSVFFNSKTVCRIAALLAASWFLYWIVRLTRELFM